MYKKIFVLLLCALIITCNFHSVFASRYGFSGFANEILDFMEEEATESLNSSYAQYDVSFEPYIIEENVSHHYVMGITKEGTSNTYYPHIIFESAPDLSRADEIFMFFPVDNDLWNDIEYYLIMDSYMEYFVDKLTAEETNENLVITVKLEYLNVLDQLKTGNYDSSPDLFLSNQENDEFGLYLYEGENGAECPI